MTECCTWIFTCFNTKKREDFLRTTEHWETVLQDAVETNSIHTFLEGFNKLMENRPHSDCKLSFDLQFSKFFSFFWVGHNIKALGLVCFFNVFPKYLLSPRCLPSTCSECFWTFLLTSSLWWYSMLNYSSISLCCWEICVSCLSTKVIGKWLN